jgi:hypothetical protein
MENLKSQFYVLNFICSERNDFRLPFHNRASYFRILIAFFFFNIASLGAQTNINIDPRGCDYPCAAGDTEFSPFYLSTSDDGTMSFDLSGCSTTDTMVYICFTISEPAPMGRGRVIVALDLYENDTYVETILRCYAGPNPSGTIFCTEYKYTCGNTLTIIPGYLGWANNNTPGNSCENLACSNGQMVTAFHPAGNCIGYLQQDVVCEDMMNELTDDCADPCIDEECCENLQGTSASPVIVVDNNCNGGIGRFDPPTMDCPLGSTIEYSSDNGTTWVDTIINYDQNNSISVWTRCVCDFDNDTVVSDTSMVASSPALCDCDDLSLVNAPSVEIESESTCDEIGGAPSGGAFADPPVSNNTCPAGSTLEWSDDNSNWNSNFDNMTAYDQENPITIYTRCNCDADINISSPSSSVTTTPGECPTCADLSTVTAPSVEIASESTCVEMEEIPSGGAFADPPVSNNTCPAGSTLEWSDDNSTWDSDFGNLIAYDQEIPITIYTRCNCNENTNISSPSSSVTTNPAICNLAPIPTLSQWNTLILLLIIMIFGVRAVKSQPWIREMDLN